jgi:methylmalonyl-CoA mutase, N-terminal domain
MTEEKSFLTPSGVEIGRYYGPDTGTAVAERAGQFPYTRGIQKTMYRGRLWTMRQYAGFGTAKETNERFRWLLEQGQTGLSTAFDLPTQLGLDADDPKAKGEVGRVGVHVGTIDDMERLFDGIPLEKVSTSLTINATAPVLLAFYVALAKRRKIALEALRGTLQNDILKEYIARGAYAFPSGPSLRLAGDTIEYSLNNLPNFNPISISGYHIREAGSDAVQEIAFTLANAEVYLKEVLRRGLSIDVCGARLAFFFGCHNHFLEEIAKFRAARRVWAKVMREDYGAKDPKAMALRFHVQTCGSTLTSQQPRNNAMRVSLQAMAAVLGGCQSLHTNSYDEALALPSEESAKLALRTQQILAFETGVPDTVDPVGGAYVIESLTSDLEKRITETLARVRAGGGMLAMIEKGVPQAEIQESAYRYQLEIETGRRKIVGVNTLQLPEKASKAAKTLKVSPQVEARQVKALQAFRKARGSGADAALAALAQAAKTQENLFPRILSCVEGRATLGEICGVLRREFGEHHGG